MAEARLLEIENIETAYGRSKVLFGAVARRSRPARW